MCKFGCKGWWSLKLNLFFLLLFTPGSFQQVGPIDLSADCQYKQLSDLCTTLNEALACDATPYCVHCVWNTAFIPTNAVNAKCAKCKTAVDSGKANFTDEFAYSEMLENICGIHTDAEDMEVCVDLVQNYTARNFFGNGEQFNISTHDTCSLLGFCYSPFEVNFPQLPPEVPTDKDSNSELVQSDEPIAMAKGGFGGGRGGGRGFGSGRGKGTGWGSKGILGKGYTGPKTMSHQSAGMARGASISRVGGNRMGYGYGYGGYGGHNRFLPMFILLPHMGHGGYGHGYGHGAYGRRSRYTCEFNRTEEVGGGLSNWWFVFFGVVIIAGVFYIMKRRK